MDAQILPLFFRHPIPRVDAEERLGRELARHYTAQMWSDPVRLHKAAGEYATDLSLEVCMDLIHVRQAIGADHADAHRALLKLFRSLEVCVSKSVQMVAEARGISEVMDSIDYTGSPEDAA